MSSNYKVKTLLKISALLVPLAINPVAFNIIKTELSLADRYWGEASRSPAGSEASREISTRSVTYAALRGC